MPFVLDQSPSYKWKVDLIKTLLINKHFQIPSIHIRVFRNEEGIPVKFEIPDGQHRLSSILDFVNNEFPLSEDFPKVDGKYEVKDMKFKDKQPPGYPINVTFTDGGTQSVRDSLEENLTKAKES